MKTEQYKRVVENSEVSKILKPTVLLSNAAAQPSGKIRISIHHEILIRKQDLPGEMIAALKNRLIFENPRYLKNLQFGRKESGIPPKLCCIREEGENLLLARGFAAELIKIFHQFRVGFEIFIEATEKETVPFRFTGALDEEQQRAFEEVSHRRYGVVIGPGLETMVLALYLISQRQLPALIILKRRDRFYHWRDLVCRFLRLNHGDVGLIGDGHKELNHGITIAIDRSLYRHIAGLKNRIGFVVVDQCDSANLKIFFQAVKQFTPRNVLGLARSNKRDDGLVELMHAYLGPLLFTFSPQKTICDSGPAGRIFHIRKSVFHFDYQENYSQMISALCADGLRNEMIVEDLLYSASQQNCRVLVLSERIDHLQKLRERLASAYMASVEIITGTTGDKKREGIVSQINRGKIKILMTTLKSVDTFNCKGFSSLIIACPVKASDPLTQAVGRLLPGSEQQPSVIYDYRDEPNILKASLSGRMKAYRALGFRPRETPATASADFIQ